MLPILADAMTPDVSGAFVKATESWVLVSLIVLVALALGAATFWTKFVYPRQQKARETDLEIERQKTTAALAQKDTTGNLARISDVLPRMLDHCERQLDRLIAANEARREEAQG
jgi:uncharacterized protein HemX